MKTLILLIGIVTMQAMAQNQIADNQAENDIELFFAINANKLDLPEDEKPFLLSIKNPFDLNKQADELKDKAEALRLEAKRLDEQAQTKNILASELTAKITYEQYLFSKHYLDSLARLLPNNHPKTQQILNLIEASVYCLRIAKEMREEAYSYQTSPSRLANLSNAEEKEFEAINKLNEAFVLIKQQKVSKPKPTYQIPIDIDNLVKN
jgi:hypothetical protein